MSLATVMDYKENPEAEPNMSEAFICGGERESSSRELIQILENELERLELEQTRETKCLPQPAPSTVSGRSRLRPDAKDCLCFIDSEQTASPFAVQACLKSEQ